MKPLVTFTQADDTPLLCHGAEIPSLSTGEMMYMPGGLQVITPFAGGVDAPIKVMVDRQGAAELEKQRIALMAKGKRPYFDAEHKDDGATFWPDSFFWKDGPQAGIYCRGEWTDYGKSGVMGKRWRTFSPQFHVDNKRGNPARIVCREWASPDMGGLVNDASFYSISPLWAKNATGAQSGHNDNNDNNIDMTSEQLAALQAKNAELQTELDALKAKQAANTNDELTAARVEAKAAELKASQAELENAALKAKNSTLESAENARREADADKAVQDAVSRGAILAKDQATQEQWKKLIIADPSNAALLAKQGGSQALGQRMTTATPGLQVGAAAPNHILQAYGAVAAKNAAMKLDHANAQAKGELAREAAAIYAKDIRDNELLNGVSLSAIMAADNTDANVGTLAGTLVLQRTLDLFQYKYPEILGMTTDFTDTPGQLNQTETTHVIITPAVQTYDGTANTDGRPKGWATVKPAQAVDVPITLDEYVGVPVVFGNDVLNSTVRNLFGEIAPQAVYALGGYFINKALALCTAANFNAYAGTSFSGGATTSGSTSATCDSTASMYAGMPISGTGIPTGTIVRAVTSATAFTLSAKATATNTGLTLTGNSAKVPTTYATYAKTQADFDLSSLDAIATAFDINEVPQDNRFLLLNAPYYRALASDAKVSAYFAATQSPDIITKRRLPELGGFLPHNAPYFPSANYGVGFAGHKASLVLKTRLPNTINGAVGANFPGTISTVTDPNSGITLALVQYINPSGMFAEWRIEALLGAAVGDKRGGLLLTSQ